MTDTTAIDEQPDDQAADDPADELKDPAGAEALDDPGKKALDAMKTRWRAERDKRKELEQQLAAQAPAPAGDAPDPERIRAEARAEILAQANRRIIAAEIKAAAAGRLADPGDALRLLDVDGFDVDDDGTVDGDDIAAAIDGLLKAKPYLAAPAQGRRFQGNADAGTRKGSGPSQLTRGDLQRMDPEEIVRAKAEGRLNDLLGIKS